MGSNATIFSFLDPLLEEVKDLQGKLETVIFRHIYIERNGEADSLSKSGLSKEMGE